MTKSHDAIIDSEDAAKVREQFRLRAPSNDGGSPHSNFAFTGILRCGECGAAMQTESATGRNKIYHYYNCSRAQKGSGCRNRRISAGEFDQWMVDTIIQRVLTPERMREVIAEVQELTSSWQEDHDRRRQAVIKQIKECNRRRQNLFDVLELHGKDAPNLGDLTTRLRQLNNQLKMLEEELRAIEEEDAPTVNISDEQILEATGLFSKVIQNTGDNKKLRLLMGHFIDKIVVNDSNVEMEYRPDRIVNTNEKSRELVVHSSENWLPEQGSNLRPAD
ncbi:hypothetical protein GKE73_01460 [Paludibacterium sp. dN 18-1]|uniref:Recombinase zinc beta ribbon domain-containing protein n=2 Tax=Paludibacterium denitrificans TaxID=2675226 RepID=A0A844GAS4_9NEIS|nr:hypothetical protein [Paludibacterium denitrificans]